MSGYVKKIEKELEEWRASMKTIYTDQAKAAILYGEKLAKKSNQNYIGTEHILAGLLHEKEGTAGMVLREFGVNEKKLMELMEKLIMPSSNVLLMENQGYTPKAEILLEKSQQEAISFKSEKVGTEHILLAMMKEADSVAARLLHTLNINMQKLYTEILKAMGEENLLAQEETSRKGKTKVSAGTPTLDRYSRDLTQMAKDGKLDPVVGREEEVNRIIQILSRRNKNNPCLVGEPGVGKTAIVEGLAQRIVQGLVPDSVSNKRLVVLDLSGMVAGTKYRGEFEERIKKIITEVMEQKSILLFIDELHTIIGAGGAEGTLDASNILKPSLSRGEIQIIGATTREEYRKHIEKDAALERRFQPISVEEPTQEQTIEILKGLRPYFEEHHGVTITDEAVNAAVKMSVRYISDRFLPDKAIDLIDEACAKVQLEGFAIPESMKENDKKLKTLLQDKENAIKAGDFALAKEIQEEQKNLENLCENEKRKFEKKCRNKNLEVKEESVAQIVSGWTKVPVQKLTEKESKRLAKLETILHKRVIGQEEAITAVSKAIRRGRVGLKDPSKPVGSFLFLGPTGVGKTELAKALAEAVFGTEQAMIRLDMSEYMEKHSVSKLIGSPPGYVGYEDGGQLSEKVRRNPYSVILLDEIEKAHPDVFNILLQVLDDGHITDSQGRRVDFKQTCIIMTSNAGAQNIVEPKRLGFSAGQDPKKDYEHMKSGVMEEVKRSFKPEFLNRIDEILVFHMLSQEEIKQIVSILLKEFQNRCKEQMDIDLTVRSSVKDLIAEEGYDIKYGARPLKRAIQNKIEDKMAEEILEGNIQRGDKVVLSVSKKDIKFSVND